MARKISSMPKGYHTATPVLVVKNANAAIEYYTSVFGAKELSRTLSSDGSTILRAELKFGNSLILLNDEMPAYGILSPISLGGTSTAVQLYLSNVDDIWQRAVEAEISVILPLENTYWGERTGKVIDPFGHVWILSQQTEIVSRQEIEKRAEALYGTVAVEEIATEVELTSVVDIEAIPVVDIEKAIVVEAKTKSSGSATKH